MSQHLEWHKDLRKMLRNGEIDNNFYLKATAECAYNLIKEDCHADAMYLVSKLTSEYLEDVMPQQAAEDVIFGAHIVSLAQALVDKGYAHDGTGDTTLTTSVFASRSAPS